MPFKQILDKYRKIAFSEKDKGERFERLMKAYLLTDPKYADRFRKVWLWSEFPSREDLGGNDTDIDLVAQPSILPPCDLLEALYGNLKKK
ncbi:MAG: hypothetical protein KF862_02030 [Chitinophagaceae bacterium]|nr:hypothetical protein [Chitinophagaceae bacterium]